MSGSDRFYGDYARRYASPAAPGRKLVSLAEAARILAAGRSLPPGSDIDVRSI